MAFETVLIVVKYTFVVLLCLLSYLWLRGKSRSKLRLPPGPPGLPLLGCLPFLGKELHKTLSQMAKQYGPTFGLNIGTQYFIVVDDFKGMKEVCTKEEFLDRPAGYFQITPAHTNLIELTGAEWKDHRRFQVNTLKQLGMTKRKTQLYALEEMQKVIDLLAKKTDTSGVNLEELFSPVFDNIVYFILYGKPFRADHPYIRRLPEYIKALSTTYMWEEEIYFKPWLKLLLATVYSWKRIKYQKEIKFVADIIRKEVQEHKQKLDPHNPEDFMDYYLLELSNRENAASEGFTEESLIGNVLMLIGAASATTRITLIWYLMTLAKRQDVQEKCYQEIANFGSLDRELEVGDKRRFPYLCASIAESQRANPISYINLLRQCNTDGVTINGFDVPRGTIILQNLWSMNNSEDLWKDPENFRPERFLEDNGTVFRALEHLTPFSYGKRQCPGMKLASNQLFLFTVNLLRHFKFLPPDGGVSMETIPFFNVVPLKPFVRVEIR